MKTLVVISLDVVFVHRGERPQIVSGFPMVTLPMQLRDARPMVRRATRVIDITLARATRLSGAEAPGVKAVSRRSGRPATETHDWSK